MDYANINKHRARLLLLAESIKELADEPDSIALIQSADLIAQDAAEVVKIVNALLAMEGDA